MIAMPEQGDGAQPVPRSLLFAVVTPILAGVTLLVGFALLEATGRTPFAYLQPANIAEAAGLGTASEVLRFLRSGQDPAVIRDVRPEIISSSVTRVTALEAAIWSRRVELVRLLDREQQLGDLASRRYLACLGTALRTEDIVSHLAPDGVAGCDAEAVTRAIQGRAR